MLVYKDKQYLIFDFEDGTNVKYDFATKTAIGKKGNKVKNLNSQLAGYTINDIFDCCEDKNYANFLKFIKDSAEYHPIKNIGTILDRVEKYSRFEQFFSAGIKVESNVYYSITDIPKPLLKFARDFGLTISNKMVKFYKANPNAYVFAFNSIETEGFYSINAEEIQRIVFCDTWHYNQRHHEYQYEPYFLKLINLGYNAKNLLHYIDYLMTYEAIEGAYSYMREIYDYANMMRQISPKYDKYPKNFLTTHRIASRNYARLKKEFDENKFSSIVDKTMETEIGVYSFIYPKSTEEIKDEAVQQNNCVASYIDKVLEGKCHIMFMRDKDKKDKSYITLEIRNNKVVQAKRKFNYDVSEDEDEIIDKFEKFLNKKERNVA